MLLHILMNMQNVRPATRYGIAEWYGKSFVGLEPSERQAFARSITGVKHDCPYRGDDCNKKGGVCAMRQYSIEPDSSEVVPTDRTLVTLCPERFLERDYIFTWIGETLLNTDSPIVLPEIGFLESPSSSSKRKVGKIDNVLVNPNTAILEWCALEIQAVYFSGGGMTSFFRQLASSAETLPFPDKTRRPDFRSSSTKRLMPQLQVKVPTLRRWGKKMAVVVDLPFFAAMGEMDEVEHLSNCDIVWFVVDLVDNGETVELRPRFTQFTTLERSVVGLTAGIPVSRASFEEDIVRKLKKLG